MTAELPSQSDQNWIPIAPVSAFPPREGREVRLAERDLAIFNLGGRFLAVAARCPHQGGPLADGILAGETVVCPLHSWKVCLRSGAVRAPVPASCVPTYPTRVSGEVLQVRLSSAAE